MPTILSSDPNVIAERVRGANGQVENLFVVETYDGTDRFVVDKDGNVTFAGTLATGAVAMTKLAITGTVVGNVPLTVTGASGQTADLLDVKINAGTKVFGIDKDGIIDAMTIAATLDAGVSATYLVFKSGSTYYAKNGSTGAIVVSGTDVLAFFTSLLALLTSGGKIHVKAGLYTTASHSHIHLGNAGIMIEGEGDKTIFHNFSFVIDSANCILKDYQCTGFGNTTGNVHVLLGGDHFRVHNINVRNTKDPASSMIAAFAVEAVSGTIDGGTFLDCHAIDCETFGWYFNGSGTPKHIKNVTFIGCTAINCGRYDRTNAWCAGFCIAESNTLENITMIGCEASGNWVNGFGAEGAPAKENVVLIGCTAFDNGQKGADGGCGFQINPGMSAVGCKSGRNIGDATSRGFWCPNSVVGDAYLIGCTDIGSMKNLLINSDTGRVFVSDFVGKDSAGYGVDFTVAKHIYINGLTIIDPAGVAGVAVRIGAGQTVEDCIFDNLHFLISTAVLYAFNVQNLVRVKISGTFEVDGPTSGGMYMYNTTDCILKNLTVRIKSGAIPAIAVAGTTHNLQIRDSTIQDVQVAPTMTYGVVGDANTIVENVSVTGAVTAKFLTCKFMTNSGVSTGTGAQQTIAHGLAAAPNRVILWPIDLGCPPYQSAVADATNIYITGVLSADYGWEAKII